jgi:uncharacterized membrane protein YiaA
MDLEAICRTVADEDQVMTRGSTALLAALLLLLVGSVAFMVAAWSSTESVGLPGYIWGALIVGVFFSLLVGAGLMGLVFYSARNGYDR